MSSGPESNPRTSWSGGGARAGWSIRRATRADQRATLAQHAAISRRDESAADLLVRANRRAQLLDGMAEGVVPDIVQQRRRDGRPHTV